MKPAIRIVAFAVLLAGVFGIATIAGGAVDPDRGGPDAASETSMGGHEEATMATTDEPPGGLAVAERGYRLALDRTAFPAGAERSLSFRILDDEGRPVTEFEEENGKRLHLIVVRRDLTGYQHLHPELAPDGTWSTPLRLGEPGAHRVYADFETGGESLTLGADLFAPGDFEPRQLPAPATVGRVDGYDVTLDEEDDVASFTVRRDGEEVTDIQPYLGERGHLVVLREGDLAYLHVHPVESEDDSSIAFGAELPSAGRYRMFLQFRHDDRVHTVAFTREVTR